MGLQSWTNPQLQAPGGLELVIRTAVNTPFIDVKRASAVNVTVLVFIVVAVLDAEEDDMRVCKGTDFI
jgi:hypothetical protein